MGATGTPGAAGKPPHEVGWGCPLHLVARRRGPPPSHPPLGLAGASMAEGEVLLVAPRSGTMDARAAALDGRDLAAGGGALGAVGRGPRSCGRWAGARYGGHPVGPLAFVEDG
jgi:hypothetical protein